MKVRVVSVGKDRSGLFAPAVDEYAQRLSHYARFELVEVRAVEDLLPQAGPHDWLVAMDERGKSLDSVGLAQFVGQAQNQSKNLVFVVGGDQGLTEEVRTRAHLVLALSRMTLPHRLARLVLVEQIYRAFTLLRNEPYHK